MKNNEAILEKILKKIRPSAEDAAQWNEFNLLEELDEKLSGSELNTLLLELMYRKAARVAPAALMQQYRQNRFVAPSSLPLIDFLEFELNLLKVIHSFGYEGVILSPVTPLGTCSVVATAHQNKILSATRSTEVVSDVTNVLALEICRRKKEAPNLHVEGEKLRLFTQHRHVRTPPVPVAEYTPHFAITAWAIAGKDTGEMQFEWSSFQEQIHLYKALLVDFLALPVRVKVSRRGGYSGPTQPFDRIAARLSELPREIPIEMQDEMSENGYYQGFQFKIYITLAGKEWDIADGGLVNWSQQILQNKKERMLISGMGTELLYKLLGK